MQTTWLPHVSQIVKLVRFSLWWTSIAESGDISLTRVIVLYWFMAKQREKVSKHEMTRNTNSGMTISKRGNNDHLGLWNCISGNYDIGVEEKVTKGRKAFVTTTGLGSGKEVMIFWTILVPMVTSELWVMDDSNIDKLDSFQKLIARRCQRFPNWLPSSTNYACLWWIGLENYIHTKKLLFIKTIAQMDESSIVSSLVGWHIWMKT